LSRLPGVSRDHDGRLMFTLTSEEQKEVHYFFQLLIDEHIALRTDYADNIEKAVVAQALLSYARGQVGLAEIADLEERILALRKALASIAKASTFHKLPIYTFDLGCVFELLEQKDIAAECFREFLQRTEHFLPSDVDNFSLKQRDVELAIEIATARLNEAPH
jgi:hypothetical protein